MNLQTEIRTRLAGQVARDHSDGWLARAYVFLVEIGAPPDEAIAALSDFVDEVIARKAKLRETR